MDIKPTSLEDARYMLCNAIEGGITALWMNEEADEVLIERQPKGDDGDFDYNAIHFTMKDTKKRITVTDQMLIDKLPEYLDTLHDPSSWLQLIEEDDLAGGADAEMSDCLLQFAAFGEVVYG